MGPKKKEKGKAEAKEINRANFIRTPDVVQELKGVSDLLHHSHSSGEFFAPQRLFRPWSDDEQEQWTDLEDSSTFTPHYPPSISGISTEGCVSKRVSEYLGLPTVSEADKVAAGKKKGKDSGSVEFNDNSATEDGQPLPRVFISQPTVTGKDVLSFRRRWSLQQVAVKAQLQAEEEARATAQSEVEQSVTSTDEQVESGSKKENTTINGGDTIGEGEVGRMNSTDITLDLTPAVDITEPAGAEYDPLMCAAFRLVAQYAKPFSTEPLGETAEAVPFLWKGIYPQLPSGTPCYNPAGKYCVKMFVGGKWVKVKVSDVFPVGPDNTPLLASSANPLELWPAILAKAVYTVSTACGYHHTLNDSSVGSSQQSASFISFAVHTLTGWLPNSPKNLSDIFAKDSNENISTLLEEINFGGASIISTRMIPDPEPIDVKRINEEKARSTPRKFTKKQLKDQMKKRLVEKENLIKRIRKRERHIGKIDGCVVKSFSEAFALVSVPHSSNDEEHNSIDEANLDFSDVVAPSVYPVLALSYPNRNCDDTDVQVLVAWDVHREDMKEPTVLTPVDEEVVKDDGDKVVQGGDEKEVAATSKAPPVANTNPPTTMTNRSSEVPGMIETPRTIRIPFSETDYPCSTRVCYQWISLKKMCSENSVYLFGNDTKLRTFNSANFAWHWKHKEEPVADDKAKKGKEKVKGKGDAGDEHVELGVPQVGVDAGVFPPVLLRVTPPKRLLAPEPHIDGRKDILTETQGVVEEHKETQSVVEEHNELQGVVEEDKEQQEGAGDVQVVKEGGEEIAEAVSVDSSVYTHPIDVEGGEQRDKDKFLSLTLLLQVDMARPHVVDSTSTEPVASSDDKSLVSAGNDAPYIIPDDAVIVLQEVRTDEVEPLVMRLQLCKSNPIPISRATFHIPIEKLYSGDKNSTPKEVLFLVRVFTSASLEISFHSACQVAVKDAGECWAVDSGGQSLQQEGSSQANYAQTEQIIFRIPLQFADTAVENVTSDEKTETKAEEETPETETVDPCTKINEAANAEDFVIFFFHTPDKEIYKTVSLAVCDGETESTVVAPVVGKNIFRLKRGNKPLTIVGRSFHANQNVPEFNWKVYMLSKHALKSPEEVMSGAVVPEHRPVHRYSGHYMANNKLMIMGDVITADACAFPISFRFKTEASQPFSNQQDEVKVESTETGTGTNEAVTSGVDEHLAFVIRIYSLPSRTLVRELNGRNICQYYLLDKSQLVEAPVNEVETAPVGGKDKKDVKKDKKKKGDEVPDDALEFMIEVFIDETRMVVPPSWKSRYPYRFYQSDGTTIPETSVSEQEKKDLTPDFSWQLDIMAGKVYQLRHDTHDVERFAAIKNTWENDSHGRADRAAAALAYVTALRNKKHSREEGVEEKKEVSDGPVNLPFLCEALEKEATDATMTNRENVLQFVPTMREHVVALQERQVATEVDPALIASEKEAHLQHLEASEKATVDAVTELTAFNEKMREITLQRLGTIRSQVKENFDEAIENWSHRSNYKANVELRNATLLTLLEKSAEAKEKAFPPVDEEQVDPKKAKGKGKDKKKK